MTIADKLALLEQTKEAQRVKLGLPKNLPFSQYVKFIRDPFTPAELFVNGEQGVWFDPSDLSTMFQDVNGTEPVTKDGDPVALIKDKSGNGNHAKQPTASARPIYRTDGNLHWLEFDGVDDYLHIKNLTINSRPFSFCMGFKNSGGYNLRHYLSSGETGLNFALWGASSVLGVFTGVDNTTSISVNVGRDAVIQGVFNGSSGVSELSSLTQTSTITDAGRQITGLVIGSRYNAIDRFSEMSFYGLALVDSIGAYGKEAEILMKAKSGIVL